MASFNIFSFLGKVLNNRLILFPTIITFAPKPHSNGEPSSARCLYWSRIKVISFRIEKINFFKNQNNLAFHPGPVQPPSGEGSPYDRTSAYCPSKKNWPATFFEHILAKFYSKTSRPMRQLTNVPLMSDFKLCLH